VVQIKKIQQVQHILLIQLNNKGINKMISLVLAALVACSTEEAPKAEPTPTPVVETAPAATEAAPATATETVAVPTTEATPVPATTAAPATTTGASK
jgi:hypothetical protein